MDHLTIPTISIPTPTGSPSAVPNPPSATGETVEWPRLTPLAPPAHRELSETKMTRELNHTLTSAFYERMGDTSQYPDGCRILLETRNVVTGVPATSYTAHELMVSHGGQWCRDSVRVPLDDPTRHWDAIFQM